MELDIEFEFERIRSRVGVRVRVTAKLRVRVRVRHKSDASSPLVSNPAHEKHNSEHGEVPNAKNESQTVNSVASLFSKSLFFFVSQSIPVVNHCGCIIDNIPLNLVRLRSSVGLDTLRCRLCEGGGGQEVCGLQNLRNSER